MNRMGAYNEYNEAIRRIPSEESDFGKVLRAPTSVRTDQWMEEEDTDGDDRGGIGSRIGAYLQSLRDRNRRTWVNTPQGPRELKLEETEKEFQDRMEEERAPTYPEDWWKPKYDEERRKNLRGKLVEEEYYSPSLKDMPFGSPGRIDEYKRRNWAMDHTTHPGNPTEKGRQW